MAITITRLPLLVNLQLYVGDDFLLRLRLTDAAGAPFDLAGCSVCSHIRVTTADLDVVGEFEATIDGVNSILLHLTAEVSAQLPRAGVWDVELTTAEGFVVTLVGGTITMTPDVSRCAEDLTNGGGP